MSAGASTAYFADENALGLGKLLHRAGRQDILYPGHTDLPAVPLGTADVDWMPVIGRNGFVVITRDRRIRSRPAELEAYYAHGIRSIWIGTKQDLGPQQQVELFLRHERRVQRFIVKLGGGPWALAMSMNGVRPLTLATPPSFL